MLARHRCEESTKLLEALDEIDKQYELLLQARETVLSDIDALERKVRQRIRSALTPKLLR